MSLSGAPLLIARDLVKYFPQGRTLLGQPRRLVKAVDGVSIEIRPGETLALVGESGCGKSTVGRLVLRLIEPTGGAVTFLGQDLAGLAPRRLRAFRADAQLIFQDPYASLNPRMTVGEALAEPLRLHGDLQHRERLARVAELLRLVGLKPDHAERHPHEFSGGQRQRIAIARAIAPGPKLIVCDEPVSALDVSVRSQILNLMRDLQQRLGLAYLFISHDLAVVKHVADRIAVMYLGRIVETGDTESLFQAPRHPYTRALLSAIPVAAAKRSRSRRLMDGDPPSPIDPPPGCHLHPRCPHSVARCTSEMPKLEGGATHGVACHRWQELAAETALPADVIAPGLERLLRAYAAAGEARG
jgi:peptide/nickel transport system ATP-binding protein/oligopeptide transport system ATP-binding protein